MEHEVCVDERYLTALKDLLQTFADAAEAALSTGKLPSHEQIVLNNAMDSWHQFNEQALDPASLNRD